MKHIDVLVIAETKLDNIFPISQFLMEGFPSKHSTSFQRL